MPNINFELNLNKHPKDVPNRALVSARNVQLSNDFSCLQTELSVRAHDKLNQILTNKYLAGVIPCNKEFVLFVAPNNYIEEINNNGKVLIEIIRCKEDDFNIKDNIESYDNFHCKVCYNSFVWHGGKLKGTFTYNIKSQLIIAVGESNTLTKDLIPLRTINLGKYEDDATSKDTDLGLPNSLLSLNPEIPFSRISDYNYIKGNSYKGWYTIFIRYKINSIDYTQWYNFGNNIFVDELEKFQLFNYLVAYSYEWNPRPSEIGSSSSGNNEHSGGGGNDNGHVSGDETSVSTSTSKRVGKHGFGETNINTSSSKTCNVLLEINIEHIKPNIIQNFTAYQIGFICSTKDDRKAFKTLDININTSNIKLDVTSMEQYSVEELIFKKYNYYDVKNVTNYKNRLYISNYKENYNNFSDINSLADNIHLILKKHKVDINFGELVQHDEPAHMSYTYTSAIGWAVSGDHYPYNYNHGQAGSFDPTNLPNTITGSINESAINIRTDKLVLCLYNSNYEPRPRDPDANPRRVIPKPFIIYEQADLSDNANIEIDKYVIDSQEYLRYHVVGTFAFSKNTGTDDYSLSGSYSISCEVTATYEGKNSGIITSYNNRLKNRTLIPGVSYCCYVHFVNKYGEASDGVKITDVSTIPQDTEDFEQVSFINNNGIFKITPGEGDKFPEINKIYQYEIEVKNDAVSNNVLHEYDGYFISYEKIENDIVYNGVISSYDFKQDYSHSNTEGFVNYSEKEPKIKFYCFDIDTDNILNFKFSKLVIEQDSGNWLCRVKGEDDSNPSHEGETSYANEIYAEFTTSNLADNPEYIENGNLIETVIKNKHIEFNIVKANYVSAHNFSKGNAYMGSYIELIFSDEDYDTIKGYILANKYNILKASLISTNPNIYMAENKTLICCSETFLFTDVVNTHLITNNFPGFISYNSAMIYNNNGVVLVPGYNIITGSSYYSYYYTDVFDEDDSHTDKKMNDNTLLLPVLLITFVTYSTKLHEAKSFKVFPEIVATRLEKLSDTVLQASFNFQNNVVVEAINSSDLFEDRYGTFDNVCPIIFINYIGNYVTEFNKRIIRSNPIADESFENSWRTFSTDAYKDITENKGNITNLLGLGTTLLVHTEHSIFMFDRDNTLQTNQNNTMQLAMPDIFDVDYKEVIGSYLGYGGLQDPDAYIISDYGYIFYDNDSNTIFKFKKKIDDTGAPGLENMNSSISEFITKFKPYKIRFANDIENNRFIVFISYANDRKQTIIENSEEDVDYDKQLNTITLSFNYKINKWISIHDYFFDYAFNTKYKLYMCLNNKNIENTNINSFICSINTPNITITNEQISPVVTTKNGINSRHDLYYNNFVKLLNNTLIEEYKDSVLAIMINDAYELIKTLEFITWKLYKIQHMPITEFSNFNENQSRQNYKIPYSGNKLRVYNDCIDTGYINISCLYNKFNKSVMDYKKPWYEFGNWNFNYFRDTKNSKKLKAKDMSRLYGNYFIIELVFGNEDNERIEFETLNCQLVNNKTI